MKRKNLRDLEETRDKFYEELEKAALDYGAKHVDGAHHRAYRIHPTYRDEIVDKFGYRGERYAFTADHAVLYIVDKGYYISDLPIPEKQQEYILIQGGCSTSVGFVIPKTIKVYETPYRIHNIFRSFPHSTVYRSELSRHIKLLVTFSCANYKKMKRNNKKK